MRRRRRTRRGCPLSCDQPGRLSLHSPRIGPCSREEFNLVSRHKNRSPAAPASAVDANFVQSARIVDERDRARQSFQRRRLDHAYLGADRHASACGFAHETRSTVPPSPGGHLRDPIAHRLDNLNTGQIKPPSPETVENPVDGSLPNAPAVLPYRCCSAVCTTTGQEPRACPPCGPRGMPSGPSARSTIRKLESRAGGLREMLHVRMSGRHCE